MLGQALQVIIDVAEGDFRCLSAAIVQLYVVVLRDADAAVNLDALDAGLAICLANPCLRYGDILLAGHALAQLPCHKIADVSRASNIDYRVGHLGLQSLETSDEPPKLRPFLSIGHSHVQRLLRASCHPAAQY